MVSNDIIVQVVFGADGIERVVADDVSLDLFSVRGKSVEQCFAPSGGRASWEGLIEEIQRAVQDHEARILFYFENASEALTERFIKCLETVTHEVTVVESDEATARIHFNNAIQQKNRRQYDNALQLFLKAANLWPLEEVPEKLLEEIQCEILDIEDCYEKADQDSKAWDCCEKAAGLGHCGAQWKLAEHLWSTAPAQDVKGRNRAVDWALKAANGGIAQAQRFLGDRYLEGDALEQNDEQAERWYRLAAKQGDEEAARFVTDFFGDNGQTKMTEVRRVFVLARNGDADSQVKIGTCYLNGKVVREDKKAAFLWFTRAAEQSHKEAQFRLSQCYQYGWGVAKNKAETVKWLTKAAENNHTEAQYVLAKRYFEGKGVPSDLQSAEIWAKKAAEAGHRAAVELLAQIRKCKGISLATLIQNALDKNLLQDTYIKKKATLYHQIKEELSSNYIRRTKYHLNIPDSEEVFLTFSGWGFSNVYIALTSAGIYYRSKTNDEKRKIITWRSFTKGKLTSARTNHRILFRFSSYERNPDIPFWGKQYDGELIGDGLTDIIAMERLLHFWEDLQQQVKNHWGGILELS